LIAAPLERNQTISSQFGADLLQVRAVAPGFFKYSTTQPRHHPLEMRETQTMNYPLLPVDAAAYAWQVSCCFATLLFAMFSWMIGPR
jgi:hypothetical protein